MLKILKTFYRFFAKKRAIFVLFITLIVTASVASFIIPYFYKLFVEAASKSDFSLFAKILLIYVSVEFVSLGLQVLSKYIGDVLLIDSSVDARMAVFKHLQDLDFYFHTQKSSGSLISSMKRGDAAFFSFQHEIHYHFLRTFVGFVVMIFFFSRLDIRILLITVMAFLVGLIISKVLISLNIKVRKRFNEEEDRISGIIVDNIINYDTVKLFAKEEWESSRLNLAFSDWKKSLWRYANTFRLIDISVGSLINASIFALLFLSLNLVTNLKMNIGDLVLIITFSNTFFPQMVDLIFSFREIAKSYTDIEKYFNILEQIIVIKDPSRPVEKRHVRGLIEYKNVGFAYMENPKSALSSINLTIKPGESIALVGKSGSGKTTFARLLMRFYDTTKGQIKIDGTNIKRFRKSKLRSFMGVVPQEPILFNESIKFNIGYGKERATLKDIKKAANLALIDDFIESLPLKYETLVGERGVKLSGGQKQRVAIARMILSNPDIVVFDEATSQLDSESEKKIQEAFWSVSKGKTTLIIAHRLSTAMRADRIVVLDKSRIKEIGSHSELLQIPNGIYNRFWQLQTNFE